MRKLIVLYVFIGVVFCDTCSLQKQVVQTRSTSAENVFTLSVLSSVTSNDVIFWRRSDTSNITIETTIYSDVQEELDSFTSNSSLVGNVFQLNFGSTYKPSNPDQVMSTAKTFAYSPVFCILTAIATLFSFHKNNSPLLIVLFAAFLSTFLPTSFAPCTSSSVTRVYVPDSVKQLCHNGKCISNCAVAGLGVNIHFTSPAKGEMEMLEQSFRTVRMDFAWGSTEYPKGTYNFASYDHLYNTSSSAFNITNYYILDYTNQFYDNGTSVYTDEGRQGMANWAKAAVGHFRGKGILWEMFNEPNGGFWKPSPNVTSYSLMSNAVGSAIKSNYDNEIYFGPATSGIDLNFLEGCFEMKTLDYWDAVSVHPYRQLDPETVESSYYNIRRLVAKYKPETKVGVPIFSGEWGYSTAWASNYTDQVLSTYIVREYMVNMANEIPVSIWYDWHDDGTDPNDPEHHFGTVFNAYNASATPVYKPKLQYNAAFVLQSVLNGKQFNKRLIVSNFTQDYVLVFGDEVIVAWTTANVSKVFDIPCSSGSFNVTDYLGLNTNSASCNNGIVQVTASRDPVYVIPKSENDFIKIMASSSRLPIDSFSNTGRVDLDVHIENPTSNTINVMLDGDTSFYSLAPGQATKLTRHINVYVTDPAYKYYLTVLIKDMGSFTMSTNIGSDLPITLTPVFIDSSSVVINIDTSAQPFSGTLTLVVNNQPQGQTSVSITSDAKTFTIPLVNVSIAPIVSIPVSLTLENSNSQIVGKIDTFISIEDFYTNTTIANYMIFGDGDSKVYSNVSITYGMPPEGPPTVGTGAFKVEYDFAAGWKFLRVFRKTGGPSINMTSVNKISYWLYGDNSNNSPRLRIVDSTNQYFQPVGPTINWTGWKLVSYDVFSSNTGYWGGDGVPVYPLRWDTMLLVDGGGKNTSGIVYFTPPVIM